MTNQKSDSQNFWSGYGLGMLSGSVLMYAFGTKNGRDTIKKILEHTDTLEHSVEDILHLIQSNMLSASQEEKKSEK